jgi:hypothetical protein
VVGNLRANRSPSGFAHSNDTDVGLIGLIVSLSRIGFICGPPISLKTA